MTVRDEFEAFAEAGRDREMEDEHWPTAKPILSRMPVESGDRVLDLGTGSGYAARALSGAADARSAVGLDAAPEMAHTASSHTDDPAVEFVAGDFHELPFQPNSFDHCFSMEAFFFATDPLEALGEILRILRPGGTVFCAVNFYEANHYSHVWADRLDPEMLLWSAAQYRGAFREAGFHVAAQSQVPDRETAIPSADAFPTGEFETRAEMVERYRELGTLLTVGVAP